MDPDNYADVKMDRISDAIRNPQIRAATSKSIFYLINLKMIVLVKLTLFVFMVTYIYITNNYSDVTYEGNLAISIPFDDSALNSKCMPNKNDLIQECCLNQTKKKSSYKVKER